MRRTMYLCMCKLNFIVGILPARIGFDTVEYDSSATALFSVVGRIGHIRYLREILNSRQVYDKKLLNPGISGYPGIESL